MKISEAIRAMVLQQASDIHLQAGAPPTMRVGGRLEAFEGVPLLGAEQLEAIVRALMSEAQRALFAERHELDFAYTIPEVARFRCNAFRQRGSVGLVMRVVGDIVPSFEALGLPSGVLSDFARQVRGLVLVTGPTGSGKSTTLAAMVDFVNRSFAKNIITIEDPIEILHKNQRSLVIQREVGVDTASFVDALKYAMRQDPDVLMIGEMRDKATVEAAISAAQTGHLVLSTLHTLDAVRTVNRIIDFFPPHEHTSVRILLAESLLGIMSQRLLRGADGATRVLAAEVLVNTPLIREYIKDESKTGLIKEALIEDNIRGMQTFDQHLVALFESGRVSLEEAVAASTSAHEFKLMLTQRGSRNAEEEVERLMRRDRQPRS